MSLRVAVLGGAGPLGELIYEHLTLAGHEVRRYSRLSSDPEWNFDVLATEDFGRLSTFDVVIYLAWDTKNRSDDVQHAHSTAAIRWSAEASRRGVQFLFASTTLAMSGASSSYAREKFHAETGVEASNGKIARIGLVCDDSFPFLATNLRRGLGGSILTRVLGGVHVFPVSGRQVGLAITHMIEAGESSGRVWIAEEAPIELGKLRSGRTYDSRFFTFNFLRLLLGVVARCAPRLGAMDRIAGLLYGPKSVDARYEVSPALSQGTWDECLTPERQLD